MQPSTTTLDYWKLASCGTKTLDEELLEEENIYAVGSNIDIPCTFC